MGVTILRGRFGGSKFQIGQTRSECPKIAKISKSSLYTFMCPKVALNPMQTSKKCFAHGLWVFRPLFDSFSQHSDAKNTDFDVFFMFFDDFGRSQLFGSVNRGCTGAQEPQKIKIAKNGLKHPQTSIECHKIIVSMLVLRCLKLFLSCLEVSGFSTLVHCNKTLLALQRIFAQNPSKFKNSQFL